MTRFPNHANFGPAAATAYIKIGWNLFSLKEYFVFATQHLQSGTVNPIQHI